MARRSNAWLPILLLTSSCASAYAAPLVGTTNASASGDLARRLETQAGAAQTRPAGAAPASQYVVQAGDTLWRISQRFAVSVTELRARNNLDATNAIKVGQTLTVTEAVASDAPSAKTQAALSALKAKTSTADVATPVSTSGLVSSEVVGKPAAPVAVGSPLTQSRRKYAFVWPVEGVLTSRFGARNGKGHDGVDIGAAAGTSVRSVAAGDVIFADTHGSYGNLVLVRHAGGLITVYAHNSKNLVNKGQRVKQGQTIAAVGATGHATGPHLHFEVRRGTEAVNPLSLLPP